MTIPWKALALLALVACNRDDAKKEAPAPSANALKRGVGDQPGMVAQGKSALVAQQCSIACGAKPGIDSNACTFACATSCAIQPDIPSIDACAARTASEAPPL